MPAEIPNQNEVMGRVIPLRPRRRAPPARADSARPSPVGSLDRFERGDEQDDYRHRMITNAAALAICVVLVLAGVWIANTMAQMRKDQDCVLSGRRGCTPVDVPVRSR